MKKMKYYYFVSYNCRQDETDAFGRLRMILKDKITDLCDIAAIEDYIENKFNLKNVIVINYKLLRKEVE